MGRTDDYDAVARENVKLRAELAEYKKSMAFMAERITERAMDAEEKLEAEVDRYQKLLMLANSKLTNEAREWCRDSAEKMGLLGSGDTAGGE